MASQKFGKDRPTSDRMRIELIRPAAAIHGRIDAERHGQDDGGEERREGQQQRCRQRLGDEQGDGRAAHEALAEIAGQDPLQKAEILNVERALEAERLPDVLQILLGDAAAPPISIIGGIAGQPDREGDDQGHGEDHENGLQQSLENKARHRGGSFLLLEKAPLARRLLDCGCQSGRYSTVTSVKRKRRSAGGIEVLQPLAHAHRSVFWL